MDEWVYKKFLEVGTYGCQNDGLDEADSMGREGEGRYDSI